LSAIGRRVPNAAKQTAVRKRRKAIRRHVRQIERHCEADLTCRRRQRQALLQWAYDSRKI